MLNFELKSFVSEYLYCKAEDVVNKIEDKKVDPATKIPSVALNALMQLQTICCTSKDALAALQPDEVCLLTAILSNCSDSTVANLIDKVPYAKRYMDILRTYDESAHSLASLHSCIEDIAKCFELEPQSQAFAIAHLIDTRAVALDEIPISYIDSVISYIRVATILSNKLDRILPDILSKGSNIEHLYIRNSSLSVIPTLPKCENISLKLMNELTYIAMQPECKKFSVFWAIHLKKVDELPQCQSFSLKHVSYELQELPSDMPCMHFTIQGHEYITGPHLLKLPKLNRCVSPEISNCTLQEPLILHGLRTSPGDFEAKTGDVAQCIGFRETFYGNLFIFKMKEEFNVYKIKRNNEELSYDAVLMSINSRINHHELQKYPAIEASNWTIKDSIEEPLKIEKTGKTESLSRLGYSYFYDENDGEIYFSAPAIDTLQNLWRQLQSTYTDLPDLKIFDSQGIATNADFIGAFLEYDAILSSNQEYLHDQFTHVIPTLRCMGLENYLSIKASIKDLFAWGRNYLIDAKDSAIITPEEFNSIEHILGYIVDICSSNIEDFYSTNVKPFVSRKLPHEYFYTYFFVKEVESNLQDDFFVNMDNKILYEDMKKCPQVWKKIVPRHILDSFDEKTAFLNEQ